MPGVQRIRCRHPGTAALTRTCGIPSGSVTVPLGREDRDVTPARSVSLITISSRYMGTLLPFFIIIPPFLFFFLPSMQNDVIAADLATLRTGIGASEHASGIIEGRGAMQEHEEIIMDSP